MSTILTNVGAMQALQTLNTTNRSLGVTQNRISTGLRVECAGQLVLVGHRHGHAWRRVGLQGHLREPGTLESISVARQARRRWPASRRSRRRSFRPTAPAWIRRRSRTTSISSSRRSIALSTPPSSMASTCCGSAASAICSPRWIAAAAVSPFNITVNGGPDRGHLGHRYAPHRRDLGDRARRRLEAAIATAVGAAAAFGAVQGRLEIQSDFV